MLIYSLLFICLSFHSFFRKRACVITIILWHFLEVLSLICLTRLIKRFIIICLGETRKCREASWALLNKFVCPFSITTHHIDCYYGKSIEVIQITIIYSNIFHHLCRVCRIMVVPSLEECRLLLISYIASRDLVLIQIFFQSIYCEDDKVFHLAREDRKQKLMPFWRWD